MNLLSNQNTKLKKDGIFHFSIPALKSKTGMTTCPGAGECAKGCFARQGFYPMSWVQDRAEVSLEATQRVDFIDKIVAEIRQKKVTRLRIHTGGDFYNRRYLQRWFRIIEQCPQVHFYTYTKMIPFFKFYKSPLPKNLTVIYSYGGQWDKLIEPDDHHAIVYKNKFAIPDDYVDASKSDLVAINNKKVALVYHGGRHLNWGRDGSDSKNADVEASD